MELTPKELQQIQNNRIILGSMIIIVGMLIFCMYAMASFGSFVEEEQAKADILAKPCAVYKKEQDTKKFLDNSCYKYMEWK